MERAPYSFLFCYEQLVPVSDSGTYMQVRVLTFVLGPRRDTVPEGLRKSGVCD